MNLYLIFFFIYLFLVVSILCEFSEFGVWSLKFLELCWFGWEKSSKIINKYLKCSFKVYMLRVYRIFPFSILFNFKSIHTSYIYIYICCCCFCESIFKTFSQCSLVIRMSCLAFHIIYIYIPIEIYKSKRVYIYTKMRRHKYDSE